VAIDNFAYCFVMGARPCAACRPAEGVLIGGP